MAISDEGGGVNVSMPVAPIGGTGYGYGGGFGGFGGDWSWILILFLFGMFGGGFGGNFGGNFGGGMFPWLLAANNNTDNVVQSGFNQAATASTLAGLQNSITTGFSNAEVSACNRALSDLNRSFAAQTAVTSGLNDISANLAACCCENRAATADLKYTLASEACATRANSTANTQAILDKLCQLELSGKEARINELERQLTMANLQASQTAQTARLLADNAAQTQAVENYIRPPVNPAYIVPNPYGAYNYGGCGCGCNS